MQNKSCVICHQHGIAHFVTEAQTETGP